jgi:protein-L-isoaspartate(D-aspartate) O-methyltransferase
MEPGERRRGEDGAMLESRRALVITAVVAALCITVALAIRAFKHDDQGTTPQPTSPGGETPYAGMREHMVATTIELRGVTSEAVLEAMRSVPRHLFVPEDVRHLAYSDRALPIGYAQTISQPYIVAWMTELLGLEPGERVLEIGTGSAYQAAVLSELPGVEVYTIEIIEQLADSARQRLEDLGYTDVHCMQGDGYYGWPEYAPFDAIIVTAAATHEPPPLLEQLAAGGRMAIPIGPRGSVQTLWLYVKSSTGHLSAENMGGVVFVPFTGAGSDSGPGY